MFLQKLFAAIRSRFRGARVQHTEEEAAQISKRPQELLDIARPKPINPLAETEGDTTSATHLLTTPYQEMSDRQ